MQTLSHLGLRYLPKYPFRGSGLQRVNWQLVGFSFFFQDIQFEFEYMVFHRKANVFVNKTRVNKGGTVAQW